MNPPGWCHVNIFGYIPPPCAAPPARRYPSGFAGVSFATVLGLVVGLSSRCLLVAVVVVDDVFHKSVRGCGRGWWSRVWVVALPTCGRRRC